MEIAKKSKSKFHFLSCAIILLLISTAAFFPGCKNKKSDGISFAIGGAPAELAFWQQLLNDFQQQSGIKVNLLRQPTDTDLRRQGLITSLTSKRNDPDVFLMDVAWVTQFAASNWLEPFENHIDPNQLNLDIFFTNVIQLVDIYQNKLIAMPVYVDGGILYYRKDLLKKFGFENPPQTWPQLLTQAITIQSEIRKTNPYFYGFVWQGAQYEGLVCNWLEFTASNQGGILTDSQKISIDTKPNIQATKFMQDLIYKHQISPANTYTEMKEEQVRILFQQGNALFERNWPYAWPLHQSDASPVKGKVAIAPLPHFENGQSIATLGGWHVGVSKFSDQKEKSFELVKFILSYNTQKKLALGLGWNPARKDIYTDPTVINQFPHFAKLKKIFENLRPRPPIPYYTLVSEIIQKYINSALSGQYKPAQALKMAQTEIDKITKKYGNQ